ncbi:hypothetical protein GCM10011360_13550 [Primorskyibacter flagellatus]|uniref:Uncharacterized protein n=1 Tax=Primorskyibacter flagellatus TaxID=1387277 RepID=A0A917EDN1_9RHOB|nr:hypothetical protein GCM10011360_13550 [Primorskyibacter flagellatus]
MPPARWTRFWCRAPRKADANGNLGPLRETGAALTLDIANRCDRGQGPTVGGRVLGFWSPIYVIVKAVRSIIAQAET